MHAPVTLGHAGRTLAAGGFAVFESSYAAGEVLPRHFHEDAFLTFASRGSFEEVLRTRALRCAPFDVLARPAGEVHANRYGDGGTACVLVRVSRDGVERLFERPAALPRALAAPLAMRIARELADEDACSPLVVEGLLLELIGGALRPPGAAAPWLARVRESLHAHATSPVTMRELAAAAGVHPTTLARAFRAAFRCTPGEYLRRIRLEQAMNALAATNVPLAEIAATAGYCDQSHFSKAFRRATRMTPAQYRRAMRGI